jgi:hypothetical protein
MGRDLTELSTKKKGYRLERAELSHSPGEKFTKCLRKWALK